MIDLAIDVRKNDYDGWNNDEFGNIKNGVAILKGKLQPKNTGAFVDN